MLQNWRCVTQMKYVRWDLENRNGKHETRATILYDVRMPLHTEPFQWQQTTIIIGIKSATVVVVIIIHTHTDTPNGNKTRRQLNLSESVYGHKLWFYKSKLHFAAECQKFRDLNICSGNDCKHQYIVAHVFLCVCSNADRSYPKSSKRQPKCHFKSMWPIFPLVVPLLLLSPPPLDKKKTEAKTRIVYACQYCIIQIKGNKMAGKNKNKNKRNIRTSTLEKEIIESGSTQAMFEII